MRLELRADTEPATAVDLTYVTQQHCDGGSEVLFEPRCSCIHFINMHSAVQTFSAVATPSTRPMRTTVGSLASWLMAYTMMQPGGAGGRNGTTSKWDNDQEISAVSVLDDDGASGVGAAAAAAVSVALARSWAAAASQKQAAMVERTTSGSLKPGRAGFRLVAAVSNTDLARLGGSNKRSTLDHEVCTQLAALIAAQVDRYATEGSKAVTLCIHTL